MNFDINEVSIFEIDSVLEGQDLSQYDFEIEKIVNNLWANIGEFEDMLGPLFTVFLRDELLPSLYINYLSLVKLEAKYEIINVKVTTSIIDIISKNLKLKLDSNRKNYDYVFGLLTRSHFHINYPTNERSFLKRIFWSIKSQVIVQWSFFKGINVLYMNAGKLDNDFSLIPNSLDAIYIKEKKPKDALPDIDKIKAVVKENIKRMDLSIPSNMVIEVIEQRVFNYLPHTFNHIFTLAEFIKIHDIKLVISSAVNNEFFLCLLAASRIAKIDSMVISHGMPTAFNPKVNNYCTYQGTLNNFEPQYANTKQFRFKAKWFG